MLRLVNANNQDQPLSNALLQIANSEGGTGFVQAVQETWWNLSSIKHLSGVAFQKQLCLVLQWRRTAVPLFTQFKDMLLVLNLHLKERY